MKDDLGEDDAREGVSAEDHARGMIPEHEQDQTET